MRRAIVGLTKIPFGYELPLREDELIFMERSTASLAFFPGSQDVGVIASGGVGPFRYAGGIMGGAPSPSSVDIPLTGEPTFVGRVGAESTHAGSFEWAGGVSFLSGTGLSAGSGATKNSLVWEDLNENGSVDPGEIVGIPGASARPSATFNRWGVNADLRAGLLTPAGWTRVFAEGTVASNLDRGLYPADPVFLGRNLRETGVVAGFLQEATRFGLVGFRVDSYNPDSDFFDPRRGTPMVTSQNITTFSPLVGAVWPGRGRLEFQYNVVENLQGRQLNGVPTELRDNSWTLRAEVFF